eukprot:1002953-Amphidinium_carterae.2
MTGKEPVCLVKHRACQERGGGAGWRVQSNEQRTAAQPSLPHGSSQLEAWNCGLSTAVYLRKPAFRCAMQLGRLAVQG